MAEHDPDARLSARGAYAELHCLSNFSFLRGASHPEELVIRAAELGYSALAITDRNSLAGIVRAHEAAREHGLQLLVGAEITPLDAPPLVLLAPDRTAYGRLCRLITRGRLRSPKGQCAIHLADVAELGRGMVAIAPLGGPLKRGPTSGAHLLTCSPAHSGGPTSGRSAHAHSEAWSIFRATFGPDNLYLAATLDGSEPDEQRLAHLAVLADELEVPLVATQHAHYHVPDRRYLQDVLTCIREKCTLADAGTRLFSNAERHLRELPELFRRYTALPDARLAEIGRRAVARTVTLAQRCTFSLDELRYQYPRELVPAGRTAMDYLEELTWNGAAGQPENVRRLLSAELNLIRELHYEHYFLTVWDLVRFARGRGILCQGRGSAANSAVCYCLGITAVDPARHDLLFERFVSRERNEPPDIDVDFEHERREEVFQYIYEKYGRERAAITAEVITYRPRSAVRDVGKALGLSLDRVDTLAKALEWWSDEAVPEEALRHAGFDPDARTTQMLIRLVRQLLRFPRHLSQHVGGFVITESPLCEIVPLENGAMPARTIIEWDKDDIDTLGILKVDCLALGMLTALSKCFGLLAEQSRLGHTAAPVPVPRALTEIPPEDPGVYDMICAADTVGVFQIESRAQMSMLPRLRPRCFYDLVIEVAIVRPGPIQGGMIHPYLRRRDGREPVAYPSDAVRQVLGKTLGIPVFQEQVMRLAVVAAGFTPGEADQLRRAMAAWRRSGQMEKFERKLIAGMLANGYPPQFAEQIYKQIRGFGEYGFPESHAASFALLVYASAWLKRYYPAAFATAVLNSQPMGFYAPAQLVRDAQAHGVPVRPVDVNYSHWDCTLCAAAPVGRRFSSPCTTLFAPEERRAVATGRVACSRGTPREHAISPPSASPCLRGESPVLRLGFRLVRGLSASKVRGIEAAQREGPIRAIGDLARRADISRETLLRLAAADAFRSLGLSRRDALWRILSLDSTAQPRSPGAGRDGAETLFADLEPNEPPANLPAITLAETVVQDYDALGLSLSAHPLALVRDELDALRVSRNERLRTARNGTRLAVAGLVLVRQRPGTAKGIVFITLEDETGVANLLVRPPVWERDRYVARGKVALIAEGAVERQGEVVYVMVRRLHDLSARLGDVRPISRDFH